MRSAERDASDRVTATAGRGPGARLNILCNWANHVRAVCETRLDPKVLLTDDRPIFPTSTEAPVVMLFESDRLRLGVSDGVATLWLGDEAARNAIGLRFLRELDQAINAAENSPVIDVLVVRSGVPGIFATGPDLDELAHLDDAESRLEHAAIGQHVFRRFADLAQRMQTVAVIEGRCRDVGLELALACSHRLSVASPDALFSFDCRRHGVPSCWGGTVRLQGTIGLKAALDLFAGKLLPARAAARCGLIDRVVGARQARSELLWYLAELQDLKHSTQKRRGAVSIVQRIRELPIFASGLAKRAIQEHDDAIFQTIVETVMHGWRHGAAEGMSKERRAFASAIDTSESMRRQSRYRRIRRYLQSCANTSLPGRIVVVGSDQTSVDFALLALQSGCGACLLESVPSARQRGEALLRDGIARAVHNGWLNALEAQAKAKGIFSAAAEFRFAGNDLVIVADKSAQGPSAILTLESELPKEALLVSLAPLGNLTGSFNHPERCLSLLAATPVSPGNHVELRPGPATRPALAARLARWLDACGLLLTEAPVFAAESMPAVFAA